MRSGYWALAAPLSVIAVVFGIREATGAAGALSWLALVAVPPLAVVAMWRRVAPSIALTVPAVLLAIDWAAPAGLAGEAAGVALCGLSCAALGMLLEALTPVPAIRAGILVMAAVDSALVLADLLQGPSGVLNAARPGPGLPQLQRVAFGDAVMGYGDLFIAGLLGAVLARQREQTRGALACATLALAFDCLFLVVRELPATVPVALAMLLHRRIPAFSQQRARG
ncbi:MAG: hypothetical protein NVSMB51_02650 [Solirubrobacteraceae bacterium]